ncbi:hypothetical protein BW42_03060 [Exiguobacterium sp. RIT341]|nr:hypothetical protein BW42_03060 [Exiguobacterium sp. RIT341]
MLLSKALIIDFVRCIYAKLVSTILCMFSNTYIAAGKLRATHLLERLCTHRAILSLPRGHGRTILEEHGTKSTTNPSRQRVLHPKSFTSSITVFHALGSRRGISDYPEEVESYVFDGDFLKLVYLRKEGHTYPLEDIGFEDLFYESILLRVGVLKSLRIGKSNVFIKALKKPDADSFME